MRTLVFIVRLIITVFVAPVLVGYGSAWLFFKIEPYGELRKLPIATFVMYDPLSDSDRPSDAPALSQSEIQARSVHAFSTVAMIMAYIFTFFIWLPVTLIMYGRHKRHWRQHLNIGWPLVALLVFGLFLDYPIALAAVFWLAAFGLVLGFAAPTLFYFMAFAGTAVPPAIPTDPTPTEV